MPVPVEETLTSPASAARDARAGHRAFRCTPLDAWEICAGVALLALWGVLYTAGVLVSTEPYRTALVVADYVPSQRPAGLSVPIPGTLWLSLKYWLIVLTCYTASNLALLCCLAACVGAFGRRTLIAGSDTVQVPMARQRLTRQSEYAAAMVRGFFVYLALIAGLQVLCPETFSFSRATQSEYIRWAGITSLLSFILGYDPRRFFSLISRVEHLSDNQGGDGGEGNMPGRQAAVYGLNGSAPRGPAPEPPEARREDA